MEIEVKYKGEEGMDLFAHPLLAPFLGPRKKTPMSALYYDTPESGCAKAGFALRLRQEGPESVCTVKGGGVQDGVARRVEIEEKADTLDQGVQALLNRSDLPENWRDVLRGPFQEKARMEFCRLSALFSREGLVVEVCRDQGRIQAGDKEAPIDEWELELKEGPEEEFDTLRRELEKGLGLKGWEKSKFARAMELLA
ncbi:inorganic triphosphatase [Intestinimonas butyriciproducens]|uniref:CYTH domain-containing protein n=1 Tax=Intestinimonas butyriciproducens TaxID=1297617 RepID=UPI00195BDBE1|nr:CYTH domain-containing protein [Intestinimonas butyriciproducens]MBM6917329.1 CYTH domain-containing protein [Intestinimonas butyriciproducens]